MTTLALDGVSGSLYTGSDSYADQNSSTPNWYFAEDYSVVSATGSFTPTLAQLVAASGVSANSTTGSIGTAQNLESEISGVFGSFSTGAEVARPTYTRLLNGNSISNAVGNLSFFSTASSSISGVRAIGYNGPNTYSDITYFAENYVAAEIATDQNYIRSISGITGNGSVGTATGSISVAIALSSTSVAATVGSITTSSIASLGIAGSSITGIVGPTLNTSSLTRSLTGTNNSVVVGFVATTTAVTLAINGNIGTFSTGIETSASSVSISLSGNASIVNSGNIASNSSLSRAVTGLVNTTTVGFITNSASVSVPLIGKTSSISVSSISSTSTSTVNLTGSRSTSSIGNIGTLAAVSRSITGNVAIFSTGIETNTTTVSINLVGTQSSFLVGQDYADPTYFGENYLIGNISTISINHSGIVGVVSTGNTGNIDTNRQYNATLTGVSSTVSTGVEGAISAVSIPLIGYSLSTRISNLVNIADVSFVLPHLQSNTTVSSFTTTTVFNKALIGNEAIVLMGQNYADPTYFGENYLVGGILASTSITFELPWIESAVATSSIGATSAVSYELFSVSSAMSTGIEIATPSVSYNITGVGSTVHLGNLTHTVLSEFLLPSVQSALSVSSLTPVVTATQALSSVDAIVSTGYDEYAINYFGEDYSIIRSSISAFPVVIFELPCIQNTGAVGSVTTLAAVSHALTGVSSTISTGIEVAYPEVSYQIGGVAAACLVVPDWYAIDYFSEDYVNSRLATSQYLEREVTLPPSTAAVNTTPTTQTLERNLLNNASVVSIQGVVTEQEYFRELDWFETRGYAGTVQKVVSYRLDWNTATGSVGSATTHADVEFSLVGVSATVDIGGQYAVDYFGENYTISGLVTSQELTRELKDSIGGTVNQGSMVAAQSYTRILDWFESATAVSNLTPSSVVIYQLTNINASGTGRVYVVRSEQIHTRALIGNTATGHVGDSDAIDSNDITLGITNVGVIGSGHVSSGISSQALDRVLTQVSSTSSIQHIAPATPGVPDDSGLVQLLMLTQPIPGVEDSAVIFDAKSEIFRFPPIRDTVDTFAFTGQLIHNDPSAIVNIIKVTPDPKIASLKPSFNGDLITIAGKISNSFTDSFYEFAMPNGTLQKLDPGNPGVFYSIVHYSADMHRYIEITYNVTVEITIASVTQVFVIQLFQTVNNDWDAGRATLKQLSLEGQG